MKKILIIIAGLILTTPIANAQVLYVELDNGNGSAVATDQGILTAAHVVKGKKFVRVCTDRCYKARVVKVDRKNDIALLRSRIRVPKITIAKKLTKENVELRGYEYGFFSTKESFLTSVKTTHDGLLFGASGGAAVQGGKLVGIISARYAKNGIFSNQLIVPLFIIHNFLQ